MIPFIKWAFNNNDNKIKMFGSVERISKKFFGQRTLVNKKRIKENKNYLHIFIKYQKKKKQKLNLNLALRFYFGI